MLLIQIKCQYDVLCPIFSVNSTRLDFIDAINCFKYSFRKTFQASIIIYFSLIRVKYCFTLWYACHVRVSQTFSIGFKFREHAGHSTTLTFVCRKNAIVSLALYSVQKMVYVNKVIGCGNLEQFDMHDLIMVFLSSHRHQKF